MPKSYSWLTCREDVMEGGEHRWAQRVHRRPCKWWAIRLRLATQPQQDEELGEDLAQVALAKAVDAHLDQLHHERRRRLEWHLELARADRPVGTAREAAAGAIEQRREEGGAQETEEVRVALAHRARGDVQRRENVRVTRVVEVRAQQQREREGGGGARRRADLIDVEVAPVARQVGEDAIEGELPSRVSNRGVRIAAAPCESRSTKLCGGPGSGSVCVRARLARRDEKAQEELQRRHVQAGGRVERPCGAALQIGLLAHVARVHGLSTHLGGSGGARNPLQGGGCAELVPTETEWGRRHAGFLRRLEVQPERRHDLGCRSSALERTKAS